MSQTSAANALLSATSFAFCLALLGYPAAFLAVGTRGIATNW